MELRTNWGDYPSNDEDSEAEEKVDIKEDVKVEEDEQPIDDLETDSRKRLAVLAKLTRRVKLEEGFKDTRYVFKAPPFKGTEHEEAALFMWYDTLPIAIQLSMASSVVSWIENGCTGVMVVRKFSNAFSLKHRHAIKLLIRKYPTIDFNSGVKIQYKKEALISDAQKLATALAPSIHRVDETLAKGVLAVAFGRGEVKVTQPEISSYQVLIKPSKESLTFSSVKYIRRLLKKEGSVRNDIFSEIATEDVLAEFEKILPQNGTIRFREAIARFQAKKDDGWKEYTSPDPHGSDLSRTFRREPSMFYAKDYPLKPTVVRCVIEVSGKKVLGTGCYANRVRHPMLPLEDLRYDVVSVYFRPAKGVSHRDFFALLQGAAQMESIKLEFNIQQRDKVFVLGVDTSFFMDGSEMVFVKSPIVSLPVDKPTLIMPYNIVRYAIPVQLKDKTHSVGVAPVMIVPFLVYGKLKRALILHQSELRKKASLQRRFPEVEISMDILFMDSQFSGLRLFMVAMLSYASRDVGLDNTVLNELMGYILSTDSESSSMFKFEQLQGVYATYIGVLQDKELICALTYAYYHVLTTVKYYIQRGEILQVTSIPIEAISELATTEAILTALVNRFKSHATILAYLKEFSGSNMLVENVPYSYTGRAQE